MMLMTSVSTRLRPALKTQALSSKPDQAILFGKEPSAQCPSKKQGKKWAFRSLLLIPLAAVTTFIGGATDLIYYGKGNMRATQQYPRRFELRPIQNSETFVQQTPTETLDGSLMLTQAHFQVMLQHVIAHSDDDAALKQLMLNPDLDGAEKIETMQIYAKLKAGEGASQQLFNQWADKVLSHHVKPEVLAKAKAEVGQYYAQIEQQNKLAREQAQQDSQKADRGGFMMVGALLLGMIPSAFAMDMYDRGLKKLKKETP